MDAVQQHAQKLQSTDFDKVREGVEWDASGWHYSLDAKVFGPKTCQYVFVVDALNFCFWPSPGFEYDTLAVSLKNVLEKDPDAFNADRLVSIDETTLSSWFPPEYVLSQMQDRVIRLQEVGQALLDEFDGLASNMVSRANGSAVLLVQLILRFIPGFRDTSIYKGSLIHFYKRAQILVGDIWAAYGRQRLADNPFCFHDVNELTMFADYRVPQILRSMGILEYTPDLNTRIDNCVEIPFGSEEEIEIRACTVIAVELLQKSLLDLGVNLLIIEVDWLLWQQGEAVKDEIAPHHRTLTIYY